jgi:hypothetical protein
MALLLQQPGRHGGIDAARQADDHAGFHEIRSAIATFLAGCRFMSSLQGDA